MRDMALKDTGYMARNVLGYDYDRDWATSAIKRPGGVRDSGPYLQMVEFIDGTAPNKLLMAPRGSYKTTILIAYCIRRLLENPNRRFIYGMATAKQAVDVTNAIKNEFERNEKLIELFGDLKTDEWARSEFTIKGRTLNLKEPSFKAWSIEKNLTGSHCDELILDDMVISTNVRTTDALERPKYAYRQAQPLVDPGGRVIISNTSYNDDDLTSWVRRELAEQFSVLVLDSGVEIENLGDGKYGLRGTPAFPHQPMEFLQSKFSTMATTEFAHQYLNRSISSGMSEFERTQFKYSRWTNHMNAMNFYVLTDTATSSRSENCYSVIAVVGLDSTNNAYLCDLKVGHFDPYSFVRLFVDVVQYWENRVKIRAALFEKIALNRVFQVGIQEELARRAMRLNLVDVSRGFETPSKEQRIRSLQIRFREGRFHVVNTVPRHFQDIGKEKLLFSPDGYKSADGMALPDGELVNEFIRFPVYSKNDIADALADIDALDSQGNRICIGSRLSVQEMYSRNKKSSGRLVDIPALSNLVPGGSGGRSGPQYDFFESMKERMVQ